MGGFSFDFSALKPMFDQAMAATSFKLGRMPIEAGQADRAYQEWLLNQKTRRGLDQMNFAEGVRGRDAATALATAGAAREDQAAAEASPEGRMRQFQRLRNLSSIGPRYSYSQGMADQAARHMVWGGARPLTYG